MRKAIQAFNKKLDPYYLLITMLLFLVTAPITLYTIIPSPRHLIVKVEKEDINYPASINDKYLKIYSYIQDSTKNVDLKNNSIKLFNYLIKTKQQWNFTIKNRTKKVIKGINLRLLNVKNLTSSAVSSSYLLEDEKDKMLKNILFEKNSGIIYLKDAVDLPPYGELNIYLWGEFLDWMNTLSVTYDEGVAKIEYNKTFSGIKAVIGEYSSVIFITLIATFVLIYYLQLKKYGFYKKNISKSD